MPWIKAIPLRAVPMEEMIEVTVGEHRLLLVRAGGDLRAFAAQCPHASAPLAEGDLRAAYIICPLHAYRFALRDGRCLKPRDGPRLRSYPVQVRGDAVWVEL